MPKPPLPILASRPRKVHSHSNRESWNLVSPLSLLTDPRSYRLPLRAQPPLEPELPTNSMAHSASFHDLYFNLDFFVQINLLWGCCLGRFTSLNGEWSEACWSAMVYE